MEMEYKQDKSRPLQAWQNSPSSIILGLGTGIIALYQALMKALAQSRQTGTVQALIAQINLQIIVRIGQPAQVHRFTELAARFSPSGRGGMRHARDASTVHHARRTAGSAPWPAISCFAETSQRWVGRIVVLLLLLGQMPFLGTTHTGRLHERRGLGILHIPGGLLLDQQTRPSTETGRWSTTARIVATAAIIVGIGSVARGGRGTGRTAAVVESMLVAVSAARLTLTLGRGTTKGREGRSDGIQRDAALRFGLRGHAGSRQTTGVAS